MTCNECIHIEGCLSHVPRTFWDSDFCKNCDHFKDKSKIIELPCKVGDTVYSLMRGRIEEWIIYDIEIQVKRMEYILRCKTKDNEDLTWYNYEFDKDNTLFFSKNDAENKLKGEER